MKYRKMLILLPVLALVFMLVHSVVAYAIADPDSPPQMSAIYVYEDLLEEGDVGVFIDYYLDYSANATPTETVNESYLVVFIDADGVTQLKAVAPYAFVDNGYGRGFAWVYFSATEAAADFIDSANEANYRVWLIGNPTVPSGWTGDPPKTIAGIDEWYTTGDSAVLLALRILYYADVLEVIWSLDLIEATGLGNRLTTLGEGYFQNVIANLRDMAPACFSSGTIEPGQEDIDYSVAFGAVATGAIVTGTPVTLTSGVNTLNINAIGTFILELENGTYGTIEDGTATMTSPLSNIVPGTNTITVTGGVAGTLIATVALESTQQTLVDTVTGTGFDLTKVAQRFGMSRMVFSGLLWFAISIILCGASYRWESGRGGIGGVGGAGGITMLMFTMCLIGGTLLGLLDMRVTAMIGIGYGGFIGYVLFFRTSADIGRTVMFMGWMWFIVCLMGGTLMGVTPQASTRLTADITSTDTTINVSSTAGFRDAGIIVIGDERLAYHKTTATSFTGTFWRPLIRGTSDTDADAHTEGDSVRALEGALLNDSLNYNLALLSDASGIMQFITLPLVVWDMLTSFIFLPLSFLGTDMVILTYIWGIFGLGLLVTAFIAMAGGRRV